MARLEGQARQRGGPDVGDAGGAQAGCHNVPALAGVGAGREVYDGVLRLHFGELRLVRSREGVRASPRRAGLLGGDQSGVVADGAVHVAAAIFLAGGIQLQFNRLFKTDWVGVAIDTIQSFGGNPLQV